MTEIRRITVLFVSLGELTLDYSPSTAMKDLKPIRRKFSESDTESADEDENLQLLFDEINRKLSVKLHQHMTAQQQVDFLQVHKALGVMQSILFTYEGTVRQFLVGK